MKSWNTIPYQTIQTASIENGSITVAFENGDKPSIELATLLPFTPSNVVSGLTSASLNIQPDEIFIHVDNGEVLSIAWDKIRVLTDIEFSQSMASKAEEQARLIGIKLKKLREKKGIKSYELAERSGLTPQTISRIEKGHSDVGFSTLRKLLAAMGYSLRDLATQELELESEKPKQLSYTFLLKKLSRLGIDKNLITTKVIPKHIHEALSNTSASHSELLMNEAASYISSVFNWRIQDIWQKNELEVPTDAAFSALYKMPSNANTNQIKAYAHYSQYLSSIVLKSLVHSEVGEFPDSAETFLEDYKSKYKSLELESLLNYIWDLGIVVIPLNDSGLFHGAAWNLDGQFVIVLKPNSPFHSRWIFDLLHEFYHVLDHLQEDDTSAIIEFDEISSINNVDSIVEREANSFANLVLLNGKAEDYAEESTQLAKWNIANLKEAVKKVALKHKVRVDSLANYMAYRLSFQNQQWWPHATKLQITEPNPYDIAVTVLKNRISDSTLNGIEKNILKMAIN